MPTNSPNEVASKTQGPYSTDGAKTNVLDKAARLGINGTYRAIPPTGPVRTNPVSREDEVRKQNL